MRLLFKVFTLNASRRWLNLLIALTFVIGLSGGMFAWLAHAEGSRTMFPSGIGGDRANTEWRNSFYGANFLRRRTLLKVYAEAGEVILVGSSAVGVQAGDILIYDPGTVTETPIGDETIPGINGEPGNANFSCETQRNSPSGLANQGQIASRAQELAGPDTIPASGVPDRYVPCFYSVPTTGIYHVVFFGPEGDGADNEGPPTGELDLTSPDNFNEFQETSISAWDVTVRSGITSPADIDGRLFARYLALFTGSNPRPINSTLFILTPDGYRYRTDLRGLDPNGFMVYGNDVGFLDTDGAPLFHDIVAPQNQLNTPEGGVSLAPPTHFIFFNEPSDEAIQALGVPLNPVAPELDSFAFAGDLGNNDTVVGVGGTFSFNSTADGTFEMIISRDGIDFDPTNPNNRVLYGVITAGPQSVPWDGLANDGTEFPAGLDYPVRIILRSGEYHFPLLDVENSLEGGPTYELLNPPGGNCPVYDGVQSECFTAFYDDRGYTTASGVDVGTPNVVLPGAAPPNPPRSDPFRGFDTRTNQRAFGDGSSRGFGDKKGLDMWTYFPSGAQNTLVDIFAFNLLISKTDGGVTAAPGDVIAYTIGFTNTGPIIDATGVEITDTVPDNTTFNAGASTPGWSCSDGDPAGTVCTFVVGTLNAGTSDSVIFAVNLDDPLAPGVTQIFNSASIGDDGQNGPEPTDDNTADETTPTTLALVDPGITKVADVSQSRPGDLVNFSITIFNNDPPSTATATGVTLVDALPIELELVSFSVSSNPPGVAGDGDVTVDSATISTIGHPSGITETIVYTVSVDVGDLGVDEEVTLNLRTRVTDLAAPPPLDILNVATLDFNEGPPRNGRTTVNVPRPSPPPSGNGGGGGGGNGSSPTATPVPAPPATPAPELPVAFLPETGFYGISQSRLVAGGVLILSGTVLGVSLMTLIARRRSKNK